MDSSNIIPTLTSPPRLDEQELEDVQDESMTEEHTPDDEQELDQDEDIDHDIDNVDEEQSSTDNARNEERTVQSSESSSPRYNISSKDKLSEKVDHDSHSHGERSSHSKNSPRHNVDQIPDSVEHRSTHGLEDHISSRDKVPQGKESVSDLLGRRTNQRDVSTYNARNVAPPKEEFSSTVPPKTKVVKGGTTHVPHTGQSRAPPRITPRTTNVRTDRANGTGRRIHQPPKTVPPSANSMRQPPATIPIPSPPVDTTPIVIDGITMSHENIMGIKGFNRRSARRSAKRDNSGDTPDATTGSSHPPKVVAPVTMSDRKVNTIGDIDVSNESLESIEKVNRQFKRSIWIRKIPVKINEDINFDAFDDKLRDRLFKQIYAKYSTLVSSIPEGNYSLKPLPTDITIDDLYLRYKELRNTYNNEYMYTLIGKGIELIYTGLCYLMQQYFEEDTGALLNMILDTMPLHNIIIRQIKFSSGNGRTMSIMDLSPWTRLIGIIGIICIISLIYIKWGKSLGNYIPFIGETVSRRAMSGASGLAAGTLQGSEVIQSISAFFSTLAGTGGTAARTQRAPQASQAPTPSASAPPPSESSDKFVYSGVVEEE